MSFLKQKRLLLLGGLRYLLPAIKSAHDLGYYVITCDYIPNNIAHKYSDEYHNVSIIDKEEVLSLGQKLKIDGIMSFAVDPGVMTAAYVAEKMGLSHSGSYESVCILQNKDRFYSFLAQNNFNVPQAWSFSSVDDVIKREYPYPVIVKPTDSAGSKGVSRVDSSNQLKPAVQSAMAHSFSKRVIIEEFIEKEDCSSDSDSFTVDGVLKFVSFSAQRFDTDAPNPYTPSAFSWPSTMSMKQESELTSEIQRLLTLLQMRSSIYNIETRVGKNGKPYIMEVSPRGGGNRLAEVLRYATGVDLITNAVRVAVGDPIIGVEQKPYDGHWAEVILHADKNGIFKELQIAPEMSQYVVERDLWVKPGDTVEAFNGANNAIGTLILKFDTADQLETALADQKSWLSVCTQ